MVVGDVRIVLLHRQRLVQAPGTPRSGLLRPEGTAAPGRGHSGILAQMPKAQQKQKSIVGSGLRGSLPIPEELYNVPGFVNNVIRFMTESTAYANKGVAFVATLALHVGGRVKWP